MAIISHFTPNRLIYDKDNASFLQTLNELNENQIDDQVDVKKLKHE